LTELTVEHAHFLLIRLRNTVMPPTNKVRAVIADAGSISGALK